ncbi:MAG: amidohydrolase family protein [Liquorilactobacillus sp.]|uniref:amidohydrolase family protein n=1 Tax=Liquorilactobacillus sp. TaxID=2767923 RepID=UPI0039E88E6C
MKLYKGNIIFTKVSTEFTMYEQGFIAVKAGKIIETGKYLDKKYPNSEIIDFGQQLIIPAFNDVHLHAPQFPMAGLGFDQELLPWLQKYTFPMEAKYENTNYALDKYKLFLTKLWEVGTLRFVAFSTIHKESTIILMDLISQSGLKAFVGKVNMDRNSIASLTELTEDSVRDTLALIEATKKFRENVQYIVTPRFVPSTSVSLMKKLGEIADEFDLPVQSHLSENRKEVEWVKELHPESKNYTDVYQKYGLIKKNKTIMAHCIYLSEEERKLLKEEKVLVAHCPQSNADLSSGIMPLRKYLNEGLHCAIASDVAGAHVPDMNRHIVEAIQTSKLWWVNHPKDLPIKLSEAFFLATKSSGSFFGKVGSFEKEYDFDALVIKEDVHNSERTISEQLEKFIYCGDDRNIMHRYVCGKEIRKPFS